MNCGKGYTLKGNLQRHINNECNVAPRFTCPVCDKKFTHKFNLQRHVLYTHGIQETGPKNVFPNFPRRNSEELPRRNSEEMYSTHKHDVKTFQHKFS